MYRMLRALDHGSLLVPVLSRSPDEVMLTFSRSNVLPSRTLSLERGLPRYINRCISADGWPGRDCDIRAFRAATVVVGVRSLKVNRFGGGRDGQRTCNTKAPELLAWSGGGIAASDATELDAMFWRPGASMGKMGILGTMSAY